MPTQDIELRDEQMLWHLSVKWHSEMENGQRMIYADSFEVNGVTPIWPDVENSARFIVGEFQGLSGERSRKVKLYLEKYLDDVIEKQVAEEVGVPKLDAEFHERLTA